MTALRLITALPLVLLAACAPVRTGALSAASARVTNEVIARDQATLADWDARLALAGERTRGADGQGYAVARAQAWLAYARDAYAWNPRDGAADAAFAEARRLVTALEQGTIPAAAAPPMLGASRVRPDLWSELARLGDREAQRAQPAAVAEAEVALVRASHVATEGPGGAGTPAMTAFERTCELDRQVTRAEHAIALLRPAPTAVVALQGAPAAERPAPAPTLTPTPLAPLTRVVHFALNASVLSPASRVTLQSVVAVLRAHPGVNVVIEGYTDMRGDSVRNRALATRRAEAVRRALEEAALPLGRVSVAGVGTEAGAMAHASPDAFARDRRVTLAFTNAEGVPLTVADAQSIDTDHDLQVERGWRQSRGAPGAGRRATGGRGGSR